MWRERVYGGVWERRLLVPEVGLTLPASSAIVDSRVFRVAPGRYRARVSVRDLDADAGSSASERLKVPDCSRIPIGFSDLDLGSSDSAGRFTSSPTRVSSSEASRLAARVSFPDRRPGPWPRTYQFVYRILDEQGLEVRKGTQPITLTRSAAPVLVRLSSADLLRGSYLLDVALIEGRSHWRVSRSFEVEQSGSPRGRELARVLEGLSHTAEPKEIEHLGSLPPERVETQSSESVATSIEIWYHGHPLRRYVFQDRDALGRSSLVSPTLE